jgi:hypothetical protein
MPFGKSNNYAENFRVATSQKGKLAEQMWTPVIPNSQLIVFATPGDSNWKIEMLIDPTKQLFVIMIICAAAVTVIGIVIIILHCKEK